MDWSDFIIPSAGLIIFYLFALALLVQLWYYLRYFSGFAFYKKKELAPFTPPASIVICAKNEDHNIVNFLPLVFEQEYPEFEVVVVNDCSFDNTGDILNEMAKKHTNLKVVTIIENEHHAHGKKVALMMGIKGATHEHLLLTDADCYPTGKDWLKNMMQQFTPETDIVLGYGAYEKRKGFLNKVIRFDTFMIALQYLSFSLARKTYMGTGRNLAYKKSLFFSLKGFASHYHIESGDDDLFINEAITKMKSKTEICVDTPTVSKVKTTLNSWIRQKRRHVTTFEQYNFGSKFRLTMLSASLYAFYFCFVVLLIVQFQPIVVLSAFLLRLIIQLLIYNKSMKLLMEKDLLVFSPLIELCLLVLYPVVTLSNMFFKKSNWK